MNRFNLTFNGEIVAGQDPGLVKVRFANKFAIDDAVRLERFFSGETIILRRNLERRDAAQEYHELQQLGVVAALVKVTTSDTAEEISHQPRPKKSTGNSTAAQKHHVIAHAISEQTIANTATNWSGKSVDIAAAIKARRLASQQLAAEKAEQEKAALEAQQRAIAEAAAHEQALAAERLRLVEEEHARQAAEQARLTAEEGARKAAEQAEIRRLKAEDIARQKALKAAAKRKAAEEAAKRTARRNQEKAEKARRRAELEEQKRLAAEDAARLAAAIAAEDARLKAELEAIKRREAEEAARLQAEVEEKARQAAAEAARIKAEAQRLQEEAQRKSAERRRIAAEELAAREQQEIIARSASMQVSAESLPTAEAIGQHSLKPAKTRVKTSLDVPLRNRGETPEIGVPGQRKRQSGKPNLYTLRPFRNSEAVRTRAAHAGQRMRSAYTLGAFALAALLIAGGSYLRKPQYPMITGARAVAINANSEPLLLAGDSLLLHDRAGVSTKAIPLESLGISALESPVVFDSKDALLARGRLLQSTTDAATADDLQLLRCNLALASCAPFSTQLQNISVDAFVINPLDDSVLLADRSAGQLLKVDSEGAIVASAPVAIPVDPVLRLHGGLLLMNSAEGPAVSVFRYEDNAFGQQLDEILLLPPAEQGLEQARAGDFVWSGDAWWVNLRGLESGVSELHRFDEEWNYLDTVALAAGAGPVQLVNWGHKTLVNDPRYPATQRYSAEGVLEAPFASTQLQALVSGQAQRARRANAAWHGGLLLCALAALLGFGLGYWHGLRKLVYGPRREQGAEPLDDHAAALQWIEPAQNRRLQLRRIGMHYGLGVIGVLLLAIALNVSVWQLVALLLALSGPAIALLLLGRQPVGHIGVLGERLLLVDHSGLYHLAGGSRLQYRGAFLAIDDVVVFLGSRKLPAFSPAPLQRHIQPPALGGIKVDSTTIAVKLLECRHPLALGVVAMAIAATAAALLLLVPHVY